MELSECLQLLTQPGHDLTGIWCVCVCVCACVRVCVCVCCVCVGKNKPPIPNGGGDSLVSFRYPSLLSLRNIFLFIKPYRQDEVDYTHHMTITLVSHGHHIGHNIGYKMEGENWWHKQLIPITGQLLESSLSIRNNYSRNSLRQIMYNEDEGTHKTSACYQMFFV